MPGSVLINADSARLPRVRFWEVTTETVSPRWDFTSKILLWLSARYALPTTRDMNIHSLTVLFVALWSRTRLKRLTSPDFSMKKSRRKNSSDMENDVCHISETPTWCNIHSIMSATCTALLR